MRWSTGFRVLALATLGWLQAEDPLVPESKAKVDILFTLPGYVTWPRGSSMDDRSRPFNIGVLGMSGLDAALIEASTTRKVRGKPVVVRYAQRAQDLVDCHMVFLRGSDSQRLPEVMDVLRNQAVLTVSDTAHFSASGVMVSLVLDRRRISLVVNPSIMKQAGLEASSSLLRLARVVE